MASVQVTNVELMKNPAKYTDDFNFYIRFDAFEELHELNWKLVYVGSSDSEKYDQVLEDVVVGPVARGPNEFVLTAPCPDHTTIPSEHLLGVTVILLICSYRDAEFIRVGYYVNNDYATEEERENPPEKVVIENVMRNVLVEQPRVTTRTINWH
eukprot:NODE_8817_length_643_cov_39.111538_g8192_i0.p1 GENE.NODE_8817_length_643_cov_39.111538_g8192_i0~~NODE_8817_length_643_cov_39.111538_g8192_i0.p1  ORF type:complete len:154 (+),score=27.85 NODE_8817_length_643_cov_39.111538_g8192_i0:62-523(+)